MKSRKDYSKEILDKFFSAKNRILEITLKDDTVLEGIFNSFVHGDESLKEPYIIKWHFLDKNEISKPDVQIAIDGDEDLGKIINQADIKSVKFKLL